MTQNMLCQREPSLLSCFFHPSDTFCTCDTSVMIALLYSCHKIKKHKPPGKGQREEITMKKMMSMIAAAAMAVMMTVPAFAAVTEDQAQDIALRQAGVNPGSVSYMTVKQDWDDGRQEYEVKFYVGRTEYQCDVDMATGMITDFDIDFD